MDIDPSDGRPAYRRIADDLRAAIASGALRAGDKIPSERELSRRYGTAHMTARQAIGVLKDEGLITTRQGRGSFVKGRPPLRRIGSGRYSRKHRAGGRTPFMVDTAEVGEPRFEALRFGPSPASAEIAERLGIDEGDLVLVTQLRFHAGPQVMQLSTAYIPLELVHDSPVVDPKHEPWVRPTIDNLATVGINVTEVLEETRARTASADEIRDLQLQPGAQVFQMTRTMLAGDRPVETCDIILPTDRYQLSYRIPVD